MLSIIMTSTTQQQQSIFIEWIEKYPPMAKNTPESSKKRKKTTKRWEHLTKMLNENGPPIKNIVGWKKTWADYKHRAKSKLSKSKLCKTEDGSYREKQLTPFEARVIEVAGIEAGVKGITNEKEIGSASEVVAARITPSMTPSNEPPSKPCLITTDKDEKINDLLRDLLSHSADECELKPKRKEILKPNDSKESTDKCSPLKKCLDIADNVYLEKVIQILSEIRNLKKEELEYRKQIDKNFLETENRKLALKEKELSISLSTFKLKRIELNIRARGQTR